MKKIVGFLICVALALALAVPALAQDLSAVNAAKVAKQAVASVPMGAKARRVAVCDFKGDSGSLYNALSAAVQKDRRFELVERKLLDSLLKEQGLQVSDIASREHRVKFGQIKGVRAIFLGEVTSSTANPFWNELSAHIRLVDVQSGQVLMSGNFSAGGKTPLLVPSAAALVLLILLLLVLRRMRKARINRARRKSDKAAQQIGEAARLAAGQRRGLLGRLEAARGELQNAASLLADQGQDEPAQRLRRLRAALDSLADQVKTGRWGAVGADQKALAEFDKKVAGYFDEVADLARELRRKAQQGGTANLGSPMLDIENKLADLKSRLAGRP